MESTNIMSASRPKFLTILCILSFVGIGFSIVSGVWGYFSNAALASLNVGNALSAAGATGNEKLSEVANALSGLIVPDYNKLALISLIQALLNIPILVGVLMMWYQKKIGFYIYTAFEIAQPALPFVLGIGIMGSIMAIVGLFFSVIFIVLYGLNLKHMSSIDFAKNKGMASAGTPRSKQNPNAGVPMQKKDVFFETKINNVTCTQVGTAYEIGLVISAKKFFIDSETGKEKEALINDEIQIGMLKGGKEIYLKSYKFTKANTLLSLSLEQKPDKIGIDPYNKLPERAQIAS